MDRRHVLYGLGLSIYLLCFAYMILNMIETIEGRILLYIYAISIILTALLLFVGYNLTKKLLEILEKDKEE